MTTDVKYLIERLRSNKLPECSFDDGKTWEIDGVALAELLEQSASALEAKAEEIARLKEERAFAIREMSKWASAYGEAEGRLKASKWPSVVEEWREHAETAERERDALKDENERMREALKPFADVAYLIEAETEGFSDDDEFDLNFEVSLFSRWPVSIFRRARAALHPTQGG